MSNTLLSMLGSNSEIIFMRELGGEEPSPALEADIAIMGLVKSRFIYTSFLDTYVMGFLGPNSNSRASGVALDGALMNFLNQVQQSSSACVNMVIMGAGGAGKTSCMLYMLSAMMEELANQSETNSYQTESIVPIFVPLPVASFCENGGIDAFILRELHLSDQGFRSLSSRPRRVVVMLDSLDEVTFPDECEILGVIYSLLGRNPLLSSCAAGIILSTRMEFCKEHSISPEKIFMQQSPTKNIAVPVWYVQPFIDQDMKSFISRYVKTSCGSNAQMEAGLIKQIEAMNLWDHVRSPFLLYMLVTTLSQSPHLLETARENMEGYGLFTLYESYFLLLAEQHTSESLVADATVLAVAMHCDGISQGLVTKYGAMVPSLLHLPLRVENAYTDIKQSDSTNMSTLCFRHKTLQEFLVARYLYGLSCQSASACKDSFTRCNYLIKSPNVVKHFSDHLCRDLKNKHAVCANLAELVNQSHDSTIAASNALTLLSQARVIISGILPSLSGAQINHANLDGAILCGVNLRNAVLTNCSLKGADMSFTDTTALRAPGSDIYQCPSLKISFDVTKIAVHPGGEYIALAGSDGIVILNHQYEQLKSVSFTGHDQSRCKYVQFSSDGKYMAVSVGEHYHNAANVSTMVWGTVHDWLDTLGGLLKYTPPDATHQFDRFAFSDCSKYLLLTGRAATILDVQTQKVLGCYGPNIIGRSDYDTYPGGVITPDGTHLLLFDARFDVKLFRFHPTSQEGLEHVWTRCSTSLFKIESEYYDDVRDNKYCQNSLDGKYLIISGSQTVAQPWDRLLELASNIELKNTADAKPPSYGRDVVLKVDKQFNGRMDSKNSFVQSPDGKYLIKYYNEALVVFDAQTTAKLSSISKSGCTDVALNSKANHILLYHGSDVMIYDFNISAMELVFRDGHMNEISGVFALPDNSHILSSGHDGKDFLHSSLCNVSEQIQLGYGYAYKVIFSPCNRLACLFSGGTGSPSDNIRVFKFNSSDCTFESVFRQRTGSTPSACFSPCGKYFAYSYCSYEWGHGENTEHGEVIRRGVHIVAVEEILTVDPEKLHMQSNTGWHPEWSEHAAMYENCFGVLGWVDAIVWMPDSSGVCIALEHPCVDWSAPRPHDIMILPLRPGRHNATLAPVHTFPTKTKVTLQYSVCGQFVYAHTSNEKTISVIGNSACNVIAENITHFCPSPDFKYCGVSVCTSENSTLKLFELSGGLMTEQPLEVSRVANSSEISVFHRKQGKVMNIPLNECSWRWSKDSTKIAMATDDGFTVTVVARHLTGMGFYHQYDLRGFLDIVTAVDFSPRGDKCIVGSADAAVRVFDLLPADGSSVMPTLFCSLQLGPETSNFSGFRAAGVETIAENTNLRNVMLEFASDGIVTQETAIGKFSGDCSYRVV
jgi:WD40 repeat protein